METTRQKKISRLFTKLSIVFQKEAPQFTGNVMISITTVRVSPDLVNANIFLSVFPSLTDPIKIIDLITKNKGFFRKKLGYRIKNQLRLVPELSYYLDDSASFVEKIDKLLKNKYVFSFSAKRYFLTIKQKNFVHLYP